MIPTWMRNPAGYLRQIAFAAANGKNDPLSLAVSQTFKIEKEFSEVNPGCTEIVTTSIKPTILDLKYRLQENKKIKTAGENEEPLSYYILLNL